MPNFSSCSCLPCDGFDFFVNKCFNFWGRTKRQVDNSWNKGQGSHLKMMLLLGLTQISVLIACVKEKSHETMTFELIQIHGFFESSQTCNVPNVELGPKNLRLFSCQVIWCFFGPPSCLDLSLVAIYSLYFRFPVSYQFPDPFCFVLHRLRPFPQKYVFPSVWIGGGQKAENVVFRYRFQPL